MVTFQLYGLDWHSPRNAIERHCWEMLLTCPTCRRWTDEDKKNLIQTATASPPPIQSKPSPKPACPNLLKPRRHSLGVPIQGPNTAIVRLVPFFNSFADCCNCTFYHFWRQPIYSLPLLVHVPRRAFLGCSQSPWHLYDLCFLPAHHVPDYFLSFSKCFLRYDL